jgi:hypothetical protein
LWRRECPLHTPDLVSFHNFERQQRVVTGHSIGKVEKRDPDSTLFEPAVGEMEDRLDALGAVGTVLILTDGHVLVTVEPPRQCLRCRRVHFDPRPALRAQIRMAGEG